MRKLPASILMAFAIAFQLHAESAIAERVVARVDNAEITQDDVVRDTALSPPLNLDFFQKSTDEEVRQAWERQALEQAIDFLLLAKEAGRNAPADREKSQAYAAEQMQSFEKAFDTQGDFKKYMEDNRLSRDFLLKRFEQHFLIQQYIRDVEMRGFEPSAEQLAAASSAYNDAELRNDWARRDIYLSEQAARTKALIGRLRAKASIEYK